MNIEKKILEKVDVLYDDKKWGKRIDPDEWNANFKALENAHNQLVDSLTEQVNIVDEAFSNATTEGGDNIHVDYSGGDFTLQQALDHVVNDINNRYTKLQSDTLLAENTNVLIRDISYNSQTGTFTITKKDESVITIDTVIEKVPASMALKEEADGSVWLVVTNQDGSQTKTNVTSLIEDTVIKGGDVINVSSSTDSVKKVTTYTLSIKPNSIGLTHVDSELATKFEETQNAKTIAVQAKDLAIQAKDAAVTAKNNAETYASNANTYSVNSNKSATESANSALESKEYAEQAASYKNSAEVANVSAIQAKNDSETYASNSNTYSENASKSATDSANSALEAKGYAEQSASHKASAEAAQTASEEARDTAIQKASDAYQSAQSAESSMTLAEKKANAASNFADNAETSANNAAGSLSAVESAKTAAETAKTDAQTAATEASKSEIAAQQFATSASQSASSASQSATNASNSATSALQSKEAASLSEANSLANKNASAESASAAATSETNAASSALAAQTAQTAAEKARDKAQEIVGGDFVTRTELNTKENKATITTATLLASGWSNGTYSFETDYPKATYDLEIALDSTATTSQAEAFNGAQIAGSATSNIIKAYGIVPTVDIPVILKVVNK